MGAYNLARVHTHDVTYHMQLVLSLEMPYTPHRALTCLTHHTEHALYGALHAPRNEPGHPRRGRSKVVCANGTRLRCAICARDIGVPPLNLHKPANLYACARRARSVVVCVVVCMCVCVSVCEYVSMCKNASVSEYHACRCTCMCMYVYMLSCAWMCASVSFSIFE